MKWLPGGWQRAERPGWGNTATGGVEPERATTPHRNLSEQETVIDRRGAGTPKRGDAGSRGTVPQATRRVRSGEPAASPPPGTLAYGMGQEPAPNRGPEHRGGRHPAEASPLLDADARDIDVSASAFRNLAVGGGISGFLTVLCAAALVDSAGSAWLWLLQLVAGIVFLWFAASARGAMASRGLLVDSRGIYPRTRGEVFGVRWEEIAAAGIGSLRPIEQRRLVHPERRRAFEFYPADPDFPARHPELDRWRVEEPAPMPDLVGVRYRFHLPPLSRLPRRFEHAVQAVAPRKWVGQYRRHLPPAPQ